MNGESDHRDYSALRATKSRDAEARRKARMMNIELTDRDAAFLRVLLTRAVHQVSRDLAEVNALPHVLANCANTAGDTLCACDHLLGLLRQPYPLDKHDGGGVGPGGEA